MGKWNGRQEMIFHHEGHEGARRFLDTPVVLRSEAKHDTGASQSFAEHTEDTEIFIIATECTECTECTENCNR
jgi:hypothetical protein